MSINRDARTFRLSDAERGTVRIKVTRSTRFERIDGFAGLKVGAKRIEATVKRKNGAWVALEVERSGGGGEHGGGDDRGGADGRIRGGDHDRGRRRQPVDRRPLGGGEGGRLSLSGSRPPSLQTTGCAATKRPSGSAAALIWRNLS